MALRGARTTSTVICARLSAPVSMSVAGFTLPGIAKNGLPMPAEPAAIAGVPKRLTAPQTVAPTTMARSEEKLIFPLPFSARIMKNKRSEQSTSLALV